MPLNDPKDAIVEKMAGANLSQQLQQTFLRAVDLARGGDDGTIAESDLEPVDQLADIESIGDYRGAGTQALGQTVMIKLNGGLGTSMGLDQAKSLLPVKEGLTFLDVITKQTSSLRSAYKSSLPLVFMNSFRTESDTLDKLRQNIEIAQGQNEIPFSFLQNKVPKLVASDFTPVTHHLDPSLEWCPPGHGDIYIALKQSGILDELLNSNYTYAFVSNADNLGASLDINLLGYFATLDAPFLMEVADRTAADKKGGHIALGKHNGRLLLREIAQTSKQDLDSFQDINRHKYFNTNSIWLNLQALNQVLHESAGIIPLPIIVNRKTVDPTDKQSTPVVQLESAMGAAIETFQHSAAIRVARNRFLPVKKTTDLLLLSSDLYSLDDSGVVNRTTDQKLPNIELDESFFGNIDDYLTRIGTHPPSLIRCESLEIKGDVHVGRNVSFIGHVKLHAPPGETLTVTDNSVING